MSLALALVVSAADAETATVRLRDAAVVSFPEYTLGEVADIHAANPALADLLRGKRVGVAPRVGYDARLSRAELLNHLLRIAPHLSIVLEGAPASRIRTAGKLRPASEVVEAARKYLEGQLKGGFSRLEVGLAKPIDDLALPVGKVNYSPRIADKAVNARKAVLVDITINKRHYTTQPIWFTIKAYQPVRVAQRPLTARCLPRADEFRIVERDVAPLRGRAVNAEADLSEHWLVRPLAAGDVLTTADLAPLPAVRRDERVTVEVVSRGMRIEARGWAMNDGQVGETVQIQSWSPDTRYFATVVGVGTVQVR